MSPIVVLVGPPGAGKSTVGRALAARLDAEFADADAVIEERLGIPVSQIFIDSGEAEFRRIEREVIADLLTSFEGVLSLGGGAVLDPDTRRDLARQPVALLTVSLASAARRVGLNRDRPLLLGNIRATLAQLMAERAPLYDEVARWTISTDDRTPEDILDEIADVIQHHPDRTELREEGER